MHCLPLVLATLDALRMVLSESVTFALKSVSKLRPQFLRDPLLIVLIDCHYGDLDLDLTGACIAGDEKTVYGIASATLNATNRLVSFVIDNLKLESEENG